MVENNDVVFASVLDEMVVGFATYFPFRSGVGYAHTKELTIIIDEKAHRKGLEHGLMDTLIKSSRAQAFTV